MLACDQRLLFLTFYVKTYSASVFIGFDIGDGGESP